MYACMYVCMYIYIYIHTSVLDVAGREADGLEQRRVVGAQGRRDGLSTGDGVLVLNLS